MLVPCRLISIFSAHRRKSFAGMSDLRHDTLLQVQCMQLDCNTCLRLPIAGTLNCSLTELFPTKGNSCKFVAMRVNVGERIGLYSFGSELRFRFSDLKRRSGVSIAKC